jgi:uncharacterized protein YjbI with pentapeptide repeats
VFYGADLTKADLYGGQLQGASLYGAKLQGASLDEAQLQGAFLVGANLQFASLDGAQLQEAILGMAQMQGARLVDAQLQGASLHAAQLQGVSLDHAHLQGASLLFAQLQGAFLRGAQLQGARLQQAQLQGATLDDAHLQGASLLFAQLQGAALDGAAINATDFWGAFLWRTNWGDLAKVASVGLKDATWKPILLAANPNDPPLPWDAQVYERLRASMNSLPEGKVRNEALKRIERLDCGNPDKNLASCDPAAAPPPEVLDWQKKLAAASVDEAAYAKALATELRGLVCASDANAIHILRGVTMYLAQLFKTGREAPALVDFIMSKDCPVSAELTEDDKATLLEIKQDAEGKYPPQAASKNRK